MRNLPLPTLIHRIHWLDKTLTLCLLPRKVHDGLTGELIMRRKTSKAVITCPRCKGVES